MSSNKVPSLVQVFWEDAASLDTEPWCYESPEAFEYVPVIFQSVGYLLHRSDMGIVITDATNYQTIP